MARPPLFPRALLLPLLIVGMAVHLAGCGGGGGGGGSTSFSPGGSSSTSTGTDAGAQPDPTPTPMPGQTPDPSPAADLDTPLRERLAAENVVPLPDPPAFPQARLDLGKALFFDKEISGNRNISCATCHHPTLSTGDADALSIGTGGSGLGPQRQPGTGGDTPRNSSSLFNKDLSSFPTLLWDGGVRRRASDGRILLANGLLAPAGVEGLLAAQAMGPVITTNEMLGRNGDTDVFGNPNELATTSNASTIWTGIMNRLRAIPEYVALFSLAFPGVPVDSLGFEHAANAIQNFQVASFGQHDSPFDRYLAGDNGALTQQQKRGGLLFYGKASCFECHGGPVLSDQAFHNIGVPQIGPGIAFGRPLDFGRELITGNQNDRFKFKTPPLRQVEISGPYMHDGAYSTLERAVRHHLDAPFALRNYDPSQLPTRLQNDVHNDGATQDQILATLDPMMQTPIDLTDGEMQDLLAFLNSLTDPDARDLSRIIPSRVPSGLPVGD